MKVVLFCGGLGLRLRGVAGVVPKPMVEVGGRREAGSPTGYAEAFHGRKVVLGRL